MLGPVPGLRACTVVLPLLAALACCGPGPDGYQGPIPSPQARETLTALFGRTLPAGSVAFCPHELRVHSFLVTPTAPSVIVADVTATAPPPAGRYWIPVLQDGDIADLHVRITGSAPAGMDTTTSATYRRFVKGE